MPPRPSLQSLLLMAASTSTGAGGSGLLVAARRRFPAAFAALGGQRIRLLHSFSSRTRLPRRPELACCFGTAPAEAVPAAPRSRNGNATGATLRGSLVLLCGAGVSFSLGIAQLRETGSPVVVFTDVLPFWDDSSFDGVQKGL
ncbi:uncharacterized protein [Triticum aestivum]|uniref:uncharacterized protein n=1 Tax=Triticum aestivum TaxID=4565 RepID=UPI001D02F6B8|nr:uncharacterized protein LOC123158324 [Triticum aestivum]